MRHAHLSRSLHARLAHSGSGGGLTTTTPRPRADHEEPRRRRHHPRRRRHQLQQLTSLLALLVALLLAAGAAAAAAAAAAAGGGVNMPPKKSTGGASAAASASASSSSLASGARSGMVLKGRWKLGKLLGEGACGEVFETADVTGAQREHGWVVKLAKLPAAPDPGAAKKKKLSKADEALKRNADTLYMEQLVYKNYLMGVPGVPALPTLLSYGEDQGFRFLVMQRLGPDLTHAFEAAGKRFPPARLADLGRQMLEALRRLHERQLVFIDVKPENFMLGHPGTPEAAAGTVFMVDFGLAEKYTASSGAHKPQEGQGAAGGAVGTPLFSSLACHQGSPAARRDDIEGLGMVLLYFARGGELPWATATSDADCLAKKKGASLAELTRGVPGGDLLKQFLEQARAMAFAAQPDYAAFDRLLAQLAKVKDTAAAAAAASGGGGAGGASGGRKRKGAGGKDGGGASSSDADADAGEGAKKKTSRGGGGSGGAAGGGGGATDADASQKRGQGRKSTSPGGWLAKAAGAVLKSVTGGVLDLTQEEEEEDGGSPPPAPAAKKKAKKTAAAAAPAGAGRGKKRGGAAAAVAAGSVVVEISSDEDEEENDENRSVASQAASVTSSVAAAAATLALDVIAGPHKGQTFALGSLSKAVVVGSDPKLGGNGNNLVLGKDPGIEAKHARLEPSGRESVHSLKLVPLGGAAVTVNRSAVGKSGRTVFQGDLIELGEGTTLKLRRA